jgi:hypothetical protein
MAVYRLFKNKAFEPEALSTMTSAYTDVCRTLGLGDRDHPQAGAAARDSDAKELVAKDLVAKKVIEFAQRGERDRVRLRERVLQALRG